MWEKPCYRYIEYSMADRGAGVDVGKAFLYMYRVFHGRQRSRG